MKKITAIMVCAVLLSAFTINVGMAQPPHIKAYYSVHHHYPPGYKASDYYTTNAYLPPVPHFRHHDRWDGRPRISVTFSSPQVVVYHRRHNDRWNDRNSVTYRNDRQRRSWWSE